MNPFYYFGIIIPALILIQSLTMHYKYRFEKKITKKICRRGLKTSQLKDVELLYTSYKMIAIDRLILAKLELQTKDTSASFIKDAFSIFSSIFTGVILVFSALLITTSTEMLNFISGNDEMKKDTSSWTKSIADFSGNITEGLQTTMIMISLLIVFSYFVILTLSTYNHMNNVVKKHLAIIEQVEKDCS